MGILLLWYSFRLISGTGEDRDGSVGNVSDHYLVPGHPGCLGKRTLLLMYGLR